VGALWFFFYLRKKLRTGEAGPPLGGHVGIDEEELQIGRESTSYGQETRPEGD
jgi:hypothetical protein